MPNCRFFKAHRKDIIHLAHFVKCKARKTHSVIRYRKNRTAPKFICYIHKKTSSFSFLAVPVS